MAETVTVSFAGPFSWPGTSEAPSVFDVEERRQPGIYLWTVPLPDAHLIYYVGETGRDFGSRLLEHYTLHAAAMYHVYSPQEFARGEKVALWPGRFDVFDRKSVTDCIASHPRLYEPIRELTFMLRFLLAPLSCEHRIRLRVEAAIANTLYAAPGIIGAFQDRGIRYHPRQGDEQPVECVVTSPVPLLGLPDQFVA